MKKQAGYINLDFTGIFIGLVLFGILLGMLLAFGIPWLWQILKPLIHGWTA